MIQAFNYNSGIVRTLERDGEIWFVAKDVCDILGLVNHKDAIKALDEEEKSGVEISDPHGRKQVTNIINESGLYRLAFRSNKPEAKKFTKWVSSEVLPTIRKTGSYGVGSSDALECARIVFEAAGLKGNQLALALNKVARNYANLDTLALGQLALEAPSKRQLLTPTEIGLELGGLSPQKVNRMMADLGLQRRLFNGKWEPTRRGEPYAVMLDTDKRHWDGTPIRQLKWESTVVNMLTDGKVCS